MKNIAIISSFFMIIMCGIMAYFLAFTDLMADKLYGAERTILIALMVVYGTYRIYRTYSLLKKDKRKTS